MNYWINLSSPTNRYPQLEDGTLLLPYACPACHKTVMATGASTSNKYMISIVYYYYCPYCGEKVDFSILNG